MKKLFVMAAVMVASFACQTTEQPFTPVAEGVSVNPNETVTEGVQGVFLLNEGAMGANNSSLDYYDYSTGRYQRDVFRKNNPGEMGLGDTGNDMQIYEGRLYIVLNGSNFVDVLDVSTAKLIKKIAIPNPRYIAFEGDFAYVTSYAGATYGGTDNGKGYVAKINLTTFEEAGKCTVGYQPDELVVAGDELYVANSGGYMAPDYDTTVSVIDLESFTLESSIEVAPNLWRIRHDGEGKLYVSSRGDYGATPATAYVVDIASGGSGEFSVSPTSVSGDNITLADGGLYAIGVSYDSSYNATNSYNLYDMATGTARGSFIADGTDADITSPYGLAVHPATGEVLLTDAGDYKNSGVLHCYTSDGEHRWSVSTGVNPNRMAFTRVGLK